MSNGVRCRIIFITGGGGGGGPGKILLAYGKNKVNCLHLLLTPEPKLQALVYDILPSTTAVFSYAIGSRKRSANEQFFCWCSNSSLSQTAHIKQGVLFIAVNKVYTSANKTTIVWTETEHLFLPGVDASHVYVCALVLGCFYSHISTWTFWRALTVSVDSCVGIKSAPSVA